jgi:hypothetical protein
MKAEKGKNMKNVKKNHTKMLIKHKVIAKIVSSLPTLWFVICQLSHV